VKPDQHQQWRVPTNQVDWDDPHLGSLLQKTEGWQLDNRGCYPPQGVQIHLGWGAGICRPAVLVWQREDVMVFKTDFPISRGEHVRVDKPCGNGFRTLWGVVAESRAGHRAGDVENSVHLHWLSMV